MRLISAQLLFAERLDGSTVRLDMIVADRERPERAPADAPLGLPFTLDLHVPSHGASAGPDVALLEHWADHRYLIDVSLVEERDDSRIVITSPAGSVSFEPTARA